MRLKITSLIRILIISILFFLLESSQAQTIKVIDISNLQSIENVAIFNLEHTKTALTNTIGQADISDFDQNDTLFFQHPSYQDMIMPFSEVARMDFLIGLAKSTVNLSEVVVSASKWEQKREEVPNKISIIKVKEIEYQNPQTTADLLSASNEVFIQKSQLGGGSPMIRGFAANSVLLVVDGVRMNNAIYRSGNLQNIISLDPNIIEDAEVIFGPGSIIYGSDALGGVMDFHTQTVKLSNDSTPLYSVKALARYSTADKEKTTHVDFNFGQKKWGSLTSFSFSDFDDLKMGSIKHPEYQRLKYVERTGSNDEMINNSDPDVQKFSGYNQWNIMQKFIYKPSKALSLNYAFHFSTTSNIPRYDRLIQYNNDTTLKYAEWYYGPQNWMMHNFNIGISDSNKLFDDARIILAYQNVEESRHDRKFGDDILRSRTEKVNIFTLNFDLDKKLSQKTTIFYGIEGFYNKVKSVAETKNIITEETGKTSTRYPDGGSDYSTIAAYANIKSNLTKKITLQAGMRASYVLLKSLFEDKTFYPFPYDKIELNTGAINGSLGLVYRPSDKWQLNTNLSSGFRAPNIDDIAKVFDSEPENVVVPNKNLKPEYAYNIDFGVIKSFNGKAKFELTIFYTYLKDVMVRRDFTFNGKDSIMYDGVMSKVQAVVNAGKGWIYGGSFAFMAGLTERIGFKTNLTYIKGEDDEKEPLRHVSPLFGNTTFSYTAAKIKLEIYANYNGEISYSNLTPSERDKPYMYAKDENGNPYSPAWFTLNIKGYYQIIKQLQINIGIENILDYRYRPYSSGIVAPGRNFIIALRAGF